MNVTHTPPRPRPDTTRRDRPSRRSKLRLPLLVSGVVALLAAVAALASGNPGSGRPQTAPVEVSGQTLPAFVDSGADAAVGMPAPVLRGVGFDGEPVAVEPAGRPLAVIFAAHWCPHCQNEVAELSPWLDAQSANELGADGVVVSTGVDPKAPNYPPSDWFEREQWPTPVLLDSDAREGAGAYGLSGYPFFTFSDARGDVVGRVSGAIGAETFDSIVGRLARQR